MRLSGEQLEYAISQYIDGTLSELDQRVLEEQMREDVEARLLVSDYQRLTTMLREADPLPEIDFNRFGASVSAAISRQTLTTARPLRIGQRRLQALGIAAAVMFAGMMAFHFLPHTTAPGVHTAEAIHIQGPAIEVAHAAPSVVVVVGPSDELARRGETLSLGNDAFVTPSPRVVISAVDIPSKSDLRPY